MATISIVLRKDKENKDGITPIHFRIVKNRKSTYVSSGIKIPAKYWDEKNKRIKPGYSNSARTNSLLIKRYTEVNAKLLAEVMENKYVTAKGISQSIKGNDCPGFLELAEMVLQRSKTDCSVGSYDARKAIIKKFKTFLNDKEIELSDISTKLLAEYDQYLQREFENGLNTRNANFKFLKMVFKEAYRLDYIHGLPNPFDRYKIKLAPTTKEYLTEEEIFEVENADLSKLPALERYRKMFVFACTAYGIRVSDLILLQEQHVIGNRIVIRTKKTKHQLDVKLPQKALDIIEWFKQRNNGSEYIFALAPKNLDLNDAVLVDLVISRETAKYNKALKKIAIEAKVTKPMSTHTARHSFATRALRKGLGIEKVSALMTHNSIKQTQVYAKIVSEELDKAADLF